MKPALTILAGLAFLGIVTNSWAVSMSAHPVFVSDVLPVLTKAGCSTGACHGAATGQGGFKLSLLGYDPLSDYDHIVRELGGRRVNRSNPAASLLLRKAAGVAPHGGGRRIVRGSLSYTCVTTWLAFGAAFGDPHDRVLSVSVSPRSSLLLKPGTGARLKVTVRRSNGTVQDVTRTALFTALDPSIATVTDAGQVTVTRRGSTAIMVRYRGQVAAARVAVPVGLTPLSSTVWQSNSPIDDAVFSELSRLRLPPSARVDDARFLRRTYLDLTGVLPQPSAVRAFLKKPSTPADRAALVDGLLRTPEFVDNWTYRLADLLLINEKRLGERGAKAYHAWLRDQIDRGTPLDQIARDLLLSTGDPGAIGPANFYRLTSDPRDMGEFVSRTLFGIRAQCARCHNHPFDRWTQDDYHAWAASFARLRFEGGRVVVSSRGEVPDPRTGRDVSPRALGQRAPMTVPADRREIASAMVSGDDSRVFARSMANRIWKYMMGRGVVEPVDDIRPTNPPSNPALLDALANELVRVRYDLRQMARAIALSRTYQTSSEPNALNRADDRLFSRAYVRPLPPVVMADAISQVCGVPFHFSNQPKGTRAAQIVGSQTPSLTLDVLGRCPRETGCEEASLYGGGLSQALHMVVGDAINEKLTAGTAVELSSEGKAAVEIVEDLYLRALSRLPTKGELNHWEGFLGRTQDRREAVQDLMWALLNSAEFAFVR